MIFQRDFYHNYAIHGLLPLPQHTVVAQQLIFGGSRCWVVGSKGRGVVTMNVLLVVIPTTMTIVSFE